MRKLWVPNKSFRKAQGNFAQTAKEAGQKGYAEIHKILLKHRKIKNWHNVEIKTFNNRF